MTKSKFNPEQRKAMSDFFVNIGSAWFIGGIITNFFTKPIVTTLLVFDIIIALANAFIWLYFSWNVLRK